jgi:beta-N-acetylhexosaminidase
VKGWQANGIAATLKHFPGLGRASGNTDDTSHVTDPTRINDTYLHPFADGIKAGAQFVMVSSAFYPHIDATHQACFSSKIINTLLRHNLHFDGIVITDSFGARSLDSVRLSQRGVRFIEAGGTMILDSAVSQLHSMAGGIMSTMKSSAHFAALVKAAVLRVLTMKARDHLL